jgi:serine/threonine protein kinase
MIVLDMRLVHSFGMVCVNLKLSNVLFNKSHRIQIVDIVGSRSESHDSAERHGSAESAESMSGMPSEFAAPEVLSGDKVTRAADVFAFAAILLSLFLTITKLEKQTNATSPAKKFQDLFRSSFLS